RHGHCALSHQTLDRSVTQTFACNALNVGRFALDVSIEAYGDNGDFMGAKKVSLQPNTGDSIPVNSSRLHSHYWCLINYSGASAAPRGNMEIFSEAGLFFFIDAR